jgi:zinc protease
MLNRRFAEFMAGTLLCIASIGALAQATKTTPSPAPQKQESPKVRNGIPQTWKQVPIPPLPKFSPQEPIRVALPNGLVIFLQPNHELPLIDATARIRGGSRSEPAEKTGMLDIYGDVWRTGGTEQRTGDQMDDVLEARAAKVETGSNADSTFISFSCLKGDFDPVFKMFMELLQHPAFREEKIVLAKDQMNTGIARRNDDTDSIAGRESVKLAYGPQNPYARVAEYTTVAAVTREDMLAWHKQHLAASDIIFGITGDFDPKQMEASLRQAFESLPKGEKAQTPKIDFTPTKPGIYLVTKTDVNQSDVRMVGLGIDRKNPDYFSLVVMNEVMGGGFSSRLFSNLRTKAGLAYSVYGGIGSAWDHPGVTEVGIGTKSATTLQAIQGLWQQLDEMRTAPPTPTELQRAKDNILNSFIFRFDTPGKVLRERMAYEYYGFPSDWLEQYRAAIDKVTIADVKRVADKYIHKDQLAVLVVGNPGEFDKPLSTLGAVTNVDITIPSANGEKAQSATAAAPTPTASNPEGKELAAKVVKFLGGADKLKTLKALRFQGTSTRVSPQGEFQLEIDTTVQFPDKLASSMSAGGQDMKLVITPTAAFQAMGGQVREMPASIRTDAVQTTKQQVYNLAQHMNDPNWVVFAEGKQKVGDAEAAVLTISGDNSTVRWFVNPATGELLQSESNAIGQSGPTKRVMQFGDWKNVDGVNFYNQRTVSENGQVIAKDEIKTWTINPTVDPKQFEKPTQ